MDSGLPVSLSSAEFIDGEMLFEVSDTSMLKGSAVTFTTDPLTFVSVDTASKKLGITIESGALRVPALDTIPTGHIITLTARSVFDTELEKALEIKVTGEMKAITAEPIFTDMYHLNNSGAVELNGSTIDIDVSKYKNDIPTGSVSAKIGSNAFASAFYDSDSGIISLSKASVGRLYGNQTVVVTFKQTDSNGDISAHTELTIPITVYSMIIYDKADLDAFGAVAKLYSSGAFTYDGYFVLGNNITYNNTSADDSTWSEYQAFTGISLINRDGGNAWGYAEDVGFAGIFDGCGYNIDGFMTGTAWPNDRGGFIGILNAKGVIRNLSFTNAVHKGLGGFLTTLAGGKIENVFIHADKHYITQSPDYPGSYKNGFLVGQESKYMLDIDNCIVIVEECISTNATDADYASTLGSFWLNNGSLSNVYAIGGMNKAVYSMNHDEYTPLGIPDIYGSYKNEEAFISAGIGLSSFDTDFWDISSGVPISLSGKELIN